MKKKKKKIKINSKKYMLIVVIIIAIFIVSIRTKNNNRILYTKIDGLYVYNEKKTTKITNIYRSKIETSTNNYYILYSDYHNLYKYNLKKTKTNKIEKKVKDYNYINNNSFIVITDKNKLFIYINDNKKYIDNNVSYIHDYNDNYVLYEKENIIYAYSIKRGKIIKPKINSTNASLKENNILIQKGLNLTIYDIDKDRIISTINNQRDFYCLNDNCSNLYYIDLNNKLIKLTSRKETIEKNTQKIQLAKQDELLYTNYQNGKYNLYYKKGTKKPKKLDSTKIDIEEIKIINNKVNYITNNHLKEVKKNGKNKRVITKNISKVIDVYKNKYLLLKNKKLYLNNKKIANNVLIDSIKTNNNKIYYLKETKNKKALYVFKNNKEKLLVKDIGDYIIENNSLYYIGNYKTSTKYGNLYKYPSKKIIDKKVVSLIIDR